MKSLWASITQIVSNEIAKIDDGAQDDGELTDSELLVTSELKEYVRGICEHPMTFANFPLREYEQHLRPALSQKQEKHAIAIIKEVPQLNALRYKLCPGRMTDTNFWNVYFLLIRNKVRGLTEEEEEDQASEPQVATKFEDLEAFHESLWREHNRSNSELDQDLHFEGINQDDDSYYAESPSVLANITTSPSTKKAAKSLMRTTTPTATTTTTKATEEREAEKGEEQKSNRATDKSEPQEKKEVGKVEERVGIEEMESGAENEEGGDTHRGGRR